MLLIPQVMEKATIRAPADGWWKLGAVNWPWRQSRAGTATGPPVADPRPDSPRIASRHVRESGCASRRVEPTLPYLPTGSPRPGCRRPVRGAGVAGRRADQRLLPEIIQRSTGAIGNPETQPGLVYPDHAVTRGRGPVPRAGTGGTAGVRPHPRRRTHGRADRAAEFANPVGGRRPSQDDTPARRSDRPGGCGVRARGPHRYAPADGRGPHVLAHTPGGNLYRILGDRDTNIDINSERSERS